MTCSWSGRGYSAASFVCPASDLGRPNYELNFDYAGQPLSKGRADVILASESGSCAQCHARSSAAVGHGATANHLFFDGHVEALPGWRPLLLRSPHKAEGTFRSLIESLQHSV